MALDIVFYPCDNVVGYSWGRCVPSADLALFEGFEVSIKTKC